MRMFSRSRFARGRYTCPAMLLSGSGAARLGPLDVDISLLADAARLLLLSWRNCAQLEPRCSAGAAAGAALLSRSCWCETCAVAACLVLEIGAADLELLDESTSEYDWEAEFLLPRGIGLEFEMRKCCFRKTSELCLKYVESELDVFENQLTTPQSRVLWKIIVLFFLS